MHQLFQAYFRHALHGRCEGTKKTGAQMGCIKHGARFRAYLVMGAGGFLSPGRKIWCAGSIGNPLDEEEFGCVTKKAPSRLSDVGAVLEAKGETRICPELTPAELEIHPPTWDCFQNFDPGAPVLAAGTSAQYGGFGCSSDGTGITCTYGKGSKRRGFTITLPLGALDRDRRGAGRTGLQAWERGSGGILRRSGGLVRRLGTGRGPADGSRRTEGA